MTIPRVAKLGASVEGTAGMKPIEVGNNLGCIILFALIAASILIARWMDAVIATWGVQP